AMYRAKHAGGGRCEIFDDRMRDQAVQRLSVQRDLARALESGEIHPWYQPIVELSTGRVTGCEALARWDHPTRGTLLPADFLEHADETDAIIRIDTIVMDAASRQVAEWNRARPASDQLCLSVNVSARHVLSDRLAEHVARALEASGLPGSALCLDMSEHAIMDDVEINRQALVQVRDLGVQVAVDDFGTGSASLAHMSRLPVDLLKIDRSFVRGLVDTREPRAALVRAIETLGHAMGLRLVVEAVETQQEYEVVRSLGIDEAQGFFWGPPTPPDEAVWATEHLDLGVSR
ncbi:putative bifunctional diguanylate cyclase/phosphodiesterase, partial [Nocardioides sp.]|uniref:putative bifunctional diguanylate cyclase/phosphodiesterase n=1 Tax=Nocardioides sp. TaxID=35761 RepID=UPI003564C945